MVYVDALNTRIYHHLVALPESLYIIAISFIQAFSLIFDTSLYRISTISELFSVLV